jgi:hypothetical protein
LFNSNPKVLQTLMKGKFDLFILLPFVKKLIFTIVAQSSLLLATTYTVFGICEAKGMNN